MKKLSVLFAAFMILAATSCKKQVDEKKTMTQPMAFQIIAFDLDSTQTASGVYMIINKGTFEGDWLIKSTNAKINAKEEDDDNTCDAHHHGKHCSLPVLFTSFYVAKSSDGKQNIITWEIGFEQNLSYYSVRVSLDGINYTELAKVYPKGIGTYSYTLDLWK